MMRPPEPLWWYGARRLIVQAVRDMTALYSQLGQCFLRLASYAALARFFEGRPLHSAAGASVHRLCKQQHSTHIADREGTLPYSYLATTASHYRRRSRHALQYRAAFL